MKLIELDNSHHIGIQEVVTVLGKLIQNMIHLIDELLVIDQRKYHLHHLIAILHVLKNFTQKLYALSYCLQ